MKKTIALIGFLAITYLVNAQTTELPYHPEADANQQLAQAQIQAMTQNKHILVFIGGNWCHWCRKLDAFVHKNDSIYKRLTDNYIVVKLNYSKEQKNDETLSELQFPQRFGFPVLVVLDAKGKRLHTQNSAYLEQKDSYSPEGIYDFLKAWTPAAINPQTYKQTKP
jgi:uncharacterized protein YyaL (SSP411 family)